MVVDSVLVAMGSSNYRRLVLRLLGYRRLLDNRKSSKE
jgi:hypothetical protein